MRWLIIAVMALGTAACGSGPHDDLDQFVRDAGQGMRGKVEPLPEVKPYEPFPYEAFNLPDPFAPRKLKPSTAGGGGGFQPDLNRRKEPLESFELEKLKMVGTLEQNHVTYALIKAPDNSLYRVKVGDHMGVNFGVIKSISEQEIKLTETIEDSAGDWSEKPNSLTLIDESNAGQQKK